MSSLIVLQGVQTVQLTRGYNTIVDECDIALVRGLNWQVYIGVRGHRYANGYVDGSQIALHRFLANPEAKQDVDHHNGDGLDNRRDNLRPCSRANNIQNERKAYGRSRFKGVDFHKGKVISLWRARIMSPTGKRLELGQFATELEAGLAYDRAAIKEFGEYACTNAQIHKDVPANKCVARISDVSEGLDRLSRYGEGRVWVAENFLYAGPDTCEIGYSDEDVDYLECRGWKFDESRCYWRRST